MFSIIAFNRFTNNKIKVKFTYSGTFITEQLLEKGTKWFSPKYAKYYFSNALLMIKQEWNALH